MDSPTNEPRWFTRKGFRAWLEAQPESAVVGVSADPCGCPLVQWALAHYEGKARDAYAVGTMIVGTSEGKDLAYFRLPPWANVYTSTVDTAFPEGTPVTREVALSLLS